MAHAFGFNAEWNTLLPLPRFNVKALSFGGMFESRSFAAQSLSMGELLRFLSMMTASKSTSSLSMKLHLLAYT